jgi:hypothetical protein
MLFPAINFQYFHISTSWSMCGDPVCCFLMCFPDMLLSHVLNVFRMVSVARFTGVAFVVTFHVHRLALVRSLYFRIFWTSYLITCVCPEIANSLSMYVPLSLSRIMMSGLFLRIVLSVGTYWFHAVVTLSSWLVYSNVWYLHISLHYYYYYYYYYYYWSQCC